MCLCSWCVLTSLGDRKGKKEHGTAGLEGPRHLLVQQPCTVDKACTEWQGWYPKQVAQCPVSCYCQSAGSLRDPHTVSDADTNTVGLPL